MFECSEELKASIEDVWKAGRVFDPNPDDYRERWLVSRQVRAVECRYRIGVLNKALSLTSKMNSRLEGVEEGKYSCP
jgi:hypothetical protein